MTAKDLEKFSGKAFDSIIIKPGRNPILSRGLVNLKTKISKHISANVPLISANMLDTTESEMAIAFARMGGLGVIHKDWSIEKQAQEVVKVKRAQNSIINRPRVLLLNDKVYKAKRLMEEERIGGILINDEQGRLAGILTTRDVNFADNLDQPISDFMTPKENLIVRGPTTTVQEAWEIFKDQNIEKLPLVDNEYKIVGLITLKDISNLKQYPLTNIDDGGKLIVGAAIGATGDYLERADALIRAGINIVFMDIKSGHSEVGARAIKEFRRVVGSFELVAGNVATSEAVNEYTDLGVDGIKLGYGPGGACTSRLVTGCGVPQFEAILESYSNQVFKYKRRQEEMPPIVADGGIRRSGHAVQALLAGASSVMLGTYIAGTYETPGPVLKRFQRREEDGMNIERIIEYKEYRGEASEFLVAERIERSGQEKTGDKMFSRTPEGTKKQVDLTGSVYEKLHVMIGGIQSGISDAGYESLEEAKKRFDPARQFIILSPEAKKESYDGR